MCGPFPTLERCMVDEKPIPNHKMDPKFFVTSLFFGASMCILTTSDLYSPNTCFKGLNMDIQQVLLLHNNFKPFVSNVLARFSNSKTFLGLHKKKFQKF
jgi:hypothetical protein